MACGLVGTNCSWLIKSLSQPCRLREHVFAAVVLLNAPCVFFSLPPHRTHTYTHTRAHFRPRAILLVLVGNYSGDLDGKTLQHLPGGRGDERRRVSVGGGLRARLLVRGNG